MAEQPAASDALDRPEPDSKRATMEDVDENPEGSEQDEQDEEGEPHEEEPEDEEEQLVMAEEEEEEDLQRPPAKRAASRLSSSSRASPSTRKRKTRDPTKPKPARTGYVIFLMERRGAVYTANPGLPLPEITKRVAKLWQELSAEEKEVYLTRSREEKLANLATATAAAVALGEPVPLPSVPRKRKRAAPRGSSLASRSGTPVVSGSTAAPPPRQAQPQPQLQGLETLQDEQDPLYCNVCRQYFTNLQHKREHLIGERHAANLETVALQTPRIKIFTDDFIHFHRARESQLRELRAEAEQLEAHVRTLADQAAEQQEVCSSLERAVHQAEEKSALFWERFGTVRSVMAEVGCGAVTPATEPGAVLQALTRFKAQLDRGDDAERQAAIGAVQQLAKGLTQALEQEKSRTTAAVAAST